MNQKKKSTCCVPICKGERFDLAHKFPRNPERTLQWLEVIDSPHLKEISLHKLSQIYQVCSRHFRNEDYKHSVSRSLNMTAIPSLNLSDLSQLHLSKSSTIEESTSDGAYIMEQEWIKIETEQAPTLEQETGQIEEQEFGCLEISQVNDEELCPANTFLEQNSISVEDECAANIALDPSVKENAEVFGSLSTFFEVHHPKYENKLSLNSFWLRCHCRCSACYDPVKCRRKISLIDIPIAIQPKAVIPHDNLDVLIIKWDDGHKSEHDINFLFTELNESNSQNVPQIPWYSNSDNILEFKSLEFGELVTSDKFIETAFSNLSQLGFTMVQTIPTQSLAMAELAVLRLFPQLQHLHFGQFDETHSDVCTNFTYSNADCGLKCFFVTEQVEMILVDGLNAAQELRSLNPKAFKTLCKVAVPLEVSDSNVKWNLTAPIIETDPFTKEILHLRLDVHRIGLLNTVPQTEIEEFYDSLKVIIGLTMKKENQWAITLVPGTMIILDNWRIFHKFLGQTGISQCFIDRKDLASRIRFFRLT